MSEISDLTEKIKKFRDERDWMQYHDAKNMAVSIVIETAELLEHFQWKNKGEVEEHIGENIDDIEEEIADIAIYLFELADNLGINLSEAIKKKLKKNALKYPVDKAKGSNAKYNKL
jgi:dCTP diphosphatase